MTRSEVYVYKNYYKFVERLGCVQQPRLFSFAVRNQICVIAATVKFTASFLVHLRFCKKTTILLSHRSISCIAWHAIQSAGTNTEAKG